MRQLIDAWKQINGNLFMVTCLLPFLIGTIVIATLPTEATTKQPTLRDKLSQPTSMVASFEVKTKHHGVYELANVNGDTSDVGDYDLEGDYKAGDVVTVLFATEDSTEIAGDVLVGTANELDLPYGRDN